MINSDRIEGAAREFAGSAQEGLGNLTGDTNTQAEGAARRAVGQAQNLYGQAADEVTDYVKGQPLAALAIAGGVGFLLGALLVRR